MTAYFAAAATLLASLGIAGIALMVSVGRVPAQSAGVVTPRVYRARSIYFILILAVAVIVLALTLPMTPYPGRFTGTKPDVVVQAVGETWSWSLTPGSAAEPVTNLVLSVGKLVEFEVSSKDVNHNFGIYNSAGELIVQAQAMPDYTNRLFYTFATPGHYYIICLEYCGIAHHLMNTDFEVR